MALVKTNVSKERSSSFIRVTRIGELGTTHVARLLVTASAVPSSPILVTLMKKAVSSTETSVLTRTARRNIPEDGFLHTKYYSRFLFETHSILCDLVVRVPGHRFRGLGFNSQRCQSFRGLVGLERGPLSLVCINEELLERKVAAPV
jgi:hypothetical protein